MNNNQNMITKILDWAYSKAITGFGGVDSAYALGDNYLKEKGTLDDRVNKLIRWQVSKAATSGFLTGIGGFAVMPFSIPANVASVIYLQIRMITAIAYMGGHDIRSDQVKTMVYASMIGNGAKEVLKDMGIRTGERVLTGIAQTASANTLGLINKKVGSKVTSKLGYKGLSKLSKAIPLMGGIVGGVFDGASTNFVGKMAKKIFIDKGNLQANVVGEEILCPSVQ